MPNKRRKMNLKDFKKELLKNPEVKKEFERFDLWFELQQLWLEFKCILNKTFRLK
jgi:glutaredoxin-related protein